MEFLHLKEGIEKEICNFFVFLIYSLNQFWVVLRSIPHGMSATLSPSQGDKGLGTGNSN